MVRRGIQLDIRNYAKRTTCIRVLLVGQITHPMCLRTAAVRLNAADRGRKGTRDSLFSNVPYSRFKQWIDFFQCSGSSQSWYKEQEYSQAVENQKNGKLILLLQLSWMNQYSESCQSRMIRQASVLNAQLEKRTFVLRLFVFVLHLFRKTAQFHQILLFVPVNQPRKIHTQKKTCDLSMQLHLLQYTR